MNKKLAQDRMLPLSPEKMTDAQRKAAAELAAGPRGGVRRLTTPFHKCDDAAWIGRQALSCRLKIRHRNCETGHLLSLA